MGYASLAPLYDRIFGEAYYRRYEGFVLRILRRLRLTPRSIVDLACGTGRLGRRLRSRGFAVTGLDRDAGMLRRARRRGLRCVRGDLRSFRWKTSYDVALCTFDSLNHLRSVRDLERCFRCVRRALAPRGIFIFDLNSDYKINAVCPSYRGRQFRVGGTEVVWLSFSRPDVWESRLTFYRRVGRGLWRRCRATIVERAFPREGVERALRRAGFGRVLLAEDFRMRPVRPTSERWYFVARVSDGPGA